MSLSKLYYGLFTVLASIYILTIFLFESEPATLARYDITDLQLKLLLVTLVIPIMLIWWAGFFGLVNLNKYARKIKGSRDGRGFSYLAAGVTVLSVMVAVDSLLSRVLAYAAQQGAIPSAVSLLTNVEISTFANLISFVLIFVGAKRLAHTVKRRPKASHMVAAAVILAAISIAYVIATFADPSRGLASASGIRMTYGMPDWLIILTIVIPNIVMWGCGLFATLFLYTYQRNVKGSIYKQALRRLTIGFFVVILITVVLQFLNAASAALTSWGLGAVLSLLYILLTAIAIGFIYIARGAKSLKKLEEIT